ncbi:MAG: glycosyltransferase family 39 protein [Planctomycetota bacterium]
MPDTAQKPARVWLALVLMVAAATRLVGLSALPPALLPDEAGNSYDAYCLLETGKDRWGAFLPLHLEAFGKGDFRPALYAYLTVPFVGFLGPEHLDVAVRLPAAIWGVATIAGLYALVRRHCDRRTALWAALFLTLSPWHLRLSRFGHESALTPGFLVFALLLLSKAGWPLRDPTDPATSRPRLRRGWMAAFGAVVALALYSYASMWLFVPAMLLTGMYVYRGFCWNASGWGCAHLDSRSARAEARGSLLTGSIAGCGESGQERCGTGILPVETQAGSLCHNFCHGLIAFAVVIAPLVWAMSTHWDQVSGRARYASLFHQGWPWTQALKQAGTQYLAHYGPTWLFTKGDQSLQSSTPGVGQLNWIMAPLLAVGLVVTWRRRRENRAYLLLLAWLLLYPAASALCTDGPHTNRAACGIGVFEWIAAIGTSPLIGWWSARRGRGTLLSAMLLAAVLANGVWSFWRYAAFVQQPSMTPLFQTDLREAVVYLRDHWTAYDRMFISDHVSRKHAWGNEHPYIYVLTYLPVEPARFQAWEKAVGYRRPYGFHYVESAGPFTFGTQPEVLKEQFRAHPEQRVLIVGRPGDVTGGQLLHTIRDACGEVRFELIEVLPR